MVKIREAIVVEGRYDKNTLSQIVEATIFETGGFGIFRNAEQMALLRMAAEHKGLIVFTDPDGAGLVIRNRIKGAIPNGYLKHAYVPDIMGKERRKRHAGKEGKLGVEGMSPEIILDALRRAGATMDDRAAEKSVAITKQDMMAYGLSGCKNSAEKRLALQKKLGFPEHMSANALLQALNFLYTPETFAQVMREL